MNRRERIVCASAIFALGLAASAPASPLVILSMEGTTNSDLTGYTSNLPVFPGETVYYEVVISLAAQGASNTHQPGGVVSPQSGTDGINSLIISLTDADHDNLGTATINGSNGWLNGIGTGPVNGGYFAGQAAGVFVANGPRNASQVLTGSFVVGSANDTLEADVDLQGGASALGGDRILIGTLQKIIAETSTTETSADPYVGLVPLTLGFLSLPEPTSLGLLACAGIGLLARRRL